MEKSWNCVFVFLWDSWHRSCDIIVCVCSPVCVCMRSQPCLQTYKLHLQTFGHNCKKTWFCCMLLYGHQHKKTCLLCLRTTKTQTSWADQMGINVRKPVFAVCEQQRRRPSCASPQSDQCLCYLLTGKYHIWTCYKQIFSFLAGLCSWGDWF